MPFTEAQVIARINNRILLIFGNDLETYVKNIVNEEIDAIIEQELKNVLREIIRSRLMNHSDFRDRLRDALEILP